MMLAYLSHLFLNVSLREAIATLRELITILNC